MTTMTEQHTETEYLERDGGRIAYDDTQNEGPLVIAVPGMATCGRSTGSWPRGWPRLVSAS